MVYLGFEPRAAVIGTDKSTELWRYFYKKIPNVKNCPRDGGFELVASKS